MQVAHSEPAKIDPACQIRLGVASWAEDNDTHSVKYAWFVGEDKKRVARGGEVPVKALPQMLDFAIRKGYVSLA